MSLPFHLLKFAFVSTLSTKTFSLLHCPYNCIMLHFCPLAKVPKAVKNYIIRIYLAKDWLFAKKFEY